MLYVPATKNISEGLVAVASECDCIFFDGSFWSDDEMARRGVGTRTALAMGHVAIDGPDGSLARLSHLRARKVYTHVNNTNPILDEASPERRAIEARGMGGRRGRDGLHAVASWCDEDEPAKQFGSRLARGFRREVARHRHRGISRQASVSRPDASGEADPAPACRPGSKIVSTINGASRRRTRPSSRRPTIATSAAPGSHASPITMASVTPRAVSANGTASQRRPASTAPTSPACAMCCRACASPSTPM